MQVKFGVYTLTLPYICYPKKILIASVSRLYCLHIRKKLQCNNNVLTLAKFLLSCKIKEEGLSAFLMNVNGHTQVIAVILCYLRCNNNDAEERESEENRI